MAEAFQCGYNEEIPGTWEMMRCPERPAYYAHVGTFALGYLCETHMLLLVDGTAQVTALYVGWL